MADSTAADSKLRAALSSQLRSAIGYDNDELSSERATAWRYYMGELSTLPSIEGRSKVMSRDVYETIETVMPSLTRVFLGTDQVFRFEPEGEEDEDAAKQATDYVAWLMRRKDNFRQIFDWMKSPLIYKNSVLHVWWEETETEVTEEYTGLSEEEFSEIVNDDSVTVEESEEYTETIHGMEAEDPPMLGGPQEQAPMTPGMEAQGMPQGMPMQPGMMMQPGAMMPPMPEQVTLYDIKIRRVKTDGEIKMEALPPEEFLTNSRAKSIEDARMCARRTRVSKSVLLNRGYDETEVEKLSADDDLYEETEQRFDDLEYDDDNDATDDAAQLCRIYEVYIQHDYDDDGKTEWRRIVMGNGPDAPVIFENDEHEGLLPFCDLTPIILPHRRIGLSMEDGAREVQRWKSTLLRMMMDGLYHSVFPRKVVDMSQIEPEFFNDVLNQAPDSIIRAKGPNAITPVATTWEGQRAFPMLEYVDGQLVRRTGVTPMGPDLNPNALQPETAEKVREDGNQGRERTELITRVYAETGFKQLARLMLHLITKHQDKERIIRLRGKWVPMDPRGWNADMDIKVSVGLGTGNRDQQMQRYMVIAQKQEQIIQTAGMNNPLVTLKNYYNTLEKMVEAADLPDVDIFFTDPDENEQPPAPPQQDPKAIEAQGKMQMEMQKFQAQQQADAQKMQAQQQMDAQKMQAEAVMAEQRMQSEAALAGQKMQAEQRMKAEEFQRTAAMQAEQFQQQLEQTRMVEGMKLEAMERQAERAYELEVQKMMIDQQFRERELVTEAELEQLKMAAGSRDGQGNINVSD